MAVFCVEFEFGEPVDVEDVGAMNADEPCRIEHRFHVRQSLLLELAFAFRAIAHIVVLSFDVVHLHHGKDVHVSAVADQNTIGLRAGRARVR